MWRYNNDHIPCIKRKRSDEMNKLKPVFEDVKEFSYNDLYLYAIGAPAGHSILNSCLEIAHMLIEKNISYGNSALDPARIFSTADSMEQLKVRIDDKLNRIKNNQGYAGDNDIDDLIGYLILLKIAKPV
jgi:hypothetical protein